MLVTCCCPSLPTSFEAGECCWSSLPSWAFYRFQHGGKVLIYNSLNYTPVHRLKCNDRKRSFYCGWCCWRQCVAPSTVSFWPWHQNWSQNSTSSYMLYTKSKRFILFSWPLCRVIPESPRWLLHKGRVDEAELVIRNAAKRNKVPAPEVIFRAVESSHHMVIHYFYVEDMYLDIITHYEYCTNSDCLFGSGMLRNKTFSIFKHRKRKGKRRGHTISSTWCAPLTLGILQFSLHPFGNCFPI